MRDKKTVAIVGAGPSGLAAAKELLQEGHRVRCFEKVADLGGVFSYRAESDAPGVWETCRLTSSILVTSFSDYFPRWREQTPFEHRHMRHHEYVEYLRSYAREFGVLPHVRFKSEVTNVSRTDDGRWTVRVHDAEAGADEELVVDAVAICSGIHRVPYTPPIPGLDRFEGQLLHAAHYRTPDSVKGRSAVFIGAGESGSEIISEATTQLDRAYVSLRRGVFVIPRLLLGLPNDYCGTRLFYSLPAFLNRRTDREARRLRRLTGLALLPVAAVRGLMARLPHRRKCGESELFLAPRSSTEAIDQREAQVEALIEKLRREAGGNQFETFATKTESFVRAVVDGRAELRPGIREVTATGVVYEDGTSVDVDSIVLCTGYARASVPFLELPEPLDLDRLYKKCFDSRLRENLAFIGFARPPIGSMPPMAEMQSRWFAQLLSGNVELPPAAEMEEDAERDLAIRATYHRRVFDRLPHMVDFSTYMDGLAGLIGAKPRLRDVLRRPKLAYKLHTAPFCAVQYRLHGPHARPELAERILLSSPSHESGFLFVYVTLAEIGRAIGMRWMRPTLSLVHEPRDPLQRSAAP